MREGGRLQREHIAFGLNHGERKRFSFLLVGHFELQPFAKPGIVDLRLTFPKAGGQFALDLEISHPQFDCTHSLGEITFRIRCTHVQPRNFTSIALCPNNHRYTSVEPMGPVRKGSNGKESACLFRIAGAGSAGASALAC